MSSCILFKFENNWYNFDNPGCTTAALPATFIISVLKVIYLVVLVFSISNFFINQNSQGRKLSPKKVPFSGNSALAYWTKYISYLGNPLGGVSQSDQGFLAILF